jgi:hypothetical protein
MAPIRNRETYVHSAARKSGSLILSEKGLIALLLTVAIQLAARSGPFRLFVSEIASSKRQNRKPYLVGVFGSMSIEQARYFIFQWQSAGLLGCMQ